MAVITDEEAFVAMLKDNIFDITTRLIYADWLEENGRSDFKAQRFLANNPNYLREILRKKNSHYSYAEKSVEGMFF